MSPERWQRVQDLYLRALDTPAGAREGFVEREAEDEEQKREVLRLLAVSTASGAAFVDRPAASLGHLAAGGIAPGDVLAGRYRIVREAGAGGMGRVYEAFDEQLATRVALKTIHPELAAHPRVLERFKAEIQLSRQVTHPNVCRVFDLGQARVGGAEIQFLTMEFLEGETLAERLRRGGKLDLATARPWMEQIAAGLEAAHRAGVVHRDLKSSNVFLAREREGGERAVVADFGVAGSFGGGAGEERRTTTGWGVGTPAYMAPEQVMGGTVGPAADLYAFGVIMYEMATGVLPYAGETPLQVAVRRVREKPAAPRTLEPGLDARWEAVILRCLETEPGDRFGRAGEIAQALEAKPLLPRMTRRNWRRMGAGAAVVAGLGLAAAGAVAWFGGTRGGAVPSTEALSWQARGITALYEGNARLAEQAFAQAAQASPSFSAAHARLAEAQLEMERLDDARASLLAGMAAGGYRAGDQLHTDAMLAYLNREVEKSLGLLARRAGEVPEAERTGALVDQARMLMRERRAHSAIPVYQEVVRRDPGNRPAWMQLGLALGQQARDEESAQAFARAEGLLREYPDAGLSRDLAYYRAAVAEARGREEMRRLAEEADRLAAPGGGYRAIRARQLLATVLGRQDDREAAIGVLKATLQQAEEQNLDLPAVRILDDLSAQYSAQSRLDEQMKVLRDARERARKIGAIRVQASLTIALAQALTRSARTGEREEAEALLRNLEREVDRPDTRDQAVALLGTRAIRAATAGDYAEAWSLYDRQARDAARFGQRRYEMLGVAGRAFVERRLRRYAAARSSYTRAQALAKELVDPVRQVTYGFDMAAQDLNLGRYAEARAGLEKLKAQATRPVDQMEWQHAWIDLISEQGQTGEALAMIEAGEKTARAKANRDAERRFAMQRCQAAAEGRLEAARRYCEALLEEAGERGLTAGNQASVRRGLARAAYARGDYGAARELARRELQAAGKDEVNRWQMLLVLAAAEQRLGHPEAVRELREQIDAAVRQFAGDNGAENVGSYLRRGIYREFLTDIGYPVPAN